MNQLLIDPNYFLFVAISMQLLVVSYLDIIGGHIRNYWSLINIFFSITLYILFPQYFFFSAEKAVYISVFLFVGFVLYLLKIMGGGDSKYIASLFLIMPGQWHEEFMEALIISTLIVGTFSLVTNIARNNESLKLAIMTMDSPKIFQALGGKFPFSPVILISWIWIGLRKFY
jgi:prepilin peptidase CpaA